MNVFEDEIKYKSFQINKYISIVNLANEIGNEDIKNKYKDNWRNRLNLDKNLGINEIIADKYVYMLISNSEYGTFTYRFLDKKNYESEDENKDNKEYKKLLPEDSKEFLFCGYVDFEKDINGIRGLNIKMEKQKDVMEAKMEEQKRDMEAKIEAQKKDMEAQKIEFEKNMALLKNEIDNLKRNATENTKNNSDEINENWQLFRRQRSRMRFRLYRRQRNRMRFRLFRRQRIRMIFRLFRRRHRKRNNKDSKK